MVMVVVVLVVVDPEENKIILLIFIYLLHILDLIKYLRREVWLSPDAVHRTGI